MFLHGSETPLAPSSPPVTPSGLDKFLASLQATARTYFDISQQTKLAKLNADLISRGLQPVTTLTPTVAPTTTYNPTYDDPVDIVGRPKPKTDWVPIIALGIAGVATLALLRKGR